MLVLGGIGLYVLDKVKKQRYKESNFLLLYDFTYCILISLPSTQGRINWDGGYRWALFFGGSIWKANSEY
jgi:hypothetical protein